MKAIIIDTSPKDVRGKDSVNLGFEIVAERYEADKAFWYDAVKAKNLKKYDTILFNVIYPTNLLNIAPALIASGINPLKSKRRGSDPQIHVGGQGVNRRGILDDIADSVFFGEIDQQQNASEITTKPMIKGDNTVIELTRGCRYKCKFCEYSWVHGGKYREKPFEMLKDQVDYVAGKRKESINFLSANFLGYSRIVELIEYTTKKNIRIVNTDVNFNDLTNVINEKCFYHKVVKMGIESFDEDTRSSINKKMSDDKLKELFLLLAKKMSYVHCYLIYGLPGDNYDKWTEWIGWLSSLRKKSSNVNIDLFGDQYQVNDKNLRIEFNITNFEPCEGTPYENAPEIDFEKKDVFLQEIFRCLVFYDFIKKKDAELDYKNTKGRFGRKEHSYKMLMQLKRSGSEITDKLINCFPGGVSRSILTPDAEKFLNFK